MVYVLDTNAIVHYLHHHPNVKLNYLAMATQGYEIVIPKMADYEIRRGFHIKPNPRRENYYEALLDDCTVIEINPNTWDYAIPIFAGHYHRRHTVDEMDILIAALCLQNDYTLVTNNSKDFQDVDGLKYVDWSLPTT